MTNNIGDRISSLRKEMNLSQEGLAEKVGVSRQAISKWERGEATPDIYNLNGLAEVFGMSIDEIVSEVMSDAVPRKPKIVGMELKKRAENFIMIGVAILIISVFTFVVLPFQDEVLFVIFGVMIAAGVLILIKAGFMFERFYMLNRDVIDRDDAGLSDDERSVRKRQQDAIGTIISLSCTVAYLILGFFFGLWHPGWLVFLLIPITYGIYELVTARRNVKSEERER